MPATLTDILEATRQRVQALKPRRVDLEAAARRAAPAPAWRAAFDGPDVAVIAEIKRRSPSAGAINEELDPVRFAAAYEAGGARAISVLTEPQHFGGSLEDLTRVSAAAAVPVLRKDFILDAVQLYEARAAGASAVLLIVRALDSEALRELGALAAELGLGVLVEVHDAAELDRALAVSAATVGVNSRDLATFEVHVDGLRDVLGRVPADVVAVAESGMSRSVDVERVASWGADAVLVGTAVARARDPAAAVRALTGVRRVRRRV